MAVAMPLRAMMLMVHGDASCDDDDDDVLSGVVWSGRRSCSRCGNSEKAEVMMRVGNDCSIEECAVYGARC